MKRPELEEIIEEEIHKYLQEKSVPQPYDRKKAERMTPAQIEKRDGLGRKWEKNPKKVAKFKKFAAKKGQGDWKDWLWASASAAALGRGFKKKNSGSNDTSKNDSSASTETPKSAAPKKKKSSGSKKTGQKKSSKAKTSPKPSAAPKSPKRPKMTAAKRKNIKEMYDFLSHQAKKDGNIQEYVNKLEQKFSMLAENNKNFDAPLMTEILHKLAKKFIDTTGESV